MDDSAIALAMARDRYKESQAKGAATFTHFLDPVRAGALLCAFQKKSGTVRAFGGYEDAERCMVGFSPEDFIPDDAFPIRALTVSYNAKFNKAPGHRDYLGSVLGLGLDRAMVGDIRLADCGAYFYVAGEIAGYIAANLERVGSVAVTVSESEAPRDLHRSGTETRITVASLRLDALVGGAFRLSRAKAQALIKSEKVTVNWAAATDVSKRLADGDVVTARGLGRVKVEGTEGKTKKDRIVLSITKY